MAVAEPARYSDMSFPPLPRQIASAVRVDIVELADLTSPDPPISSLYVETDQLQQDSLGRITCRISDILPRATVFRSPLKSTLNISLARTYSDLDVLFSLYLQVAAQRFIA